MSQPTFPLFKPARTGFEEGVVRGVYDVVRNEVQRAAFDGPGEGDHVRFNIDVPESLEVYLRALAIALGMSRRALAAKLMIGGLIEALETISKEGSRTDALPEFIAVLGEFEAALEKLKSESA